MSVFFNGHFIADECATIHISDLSIQRGYAAFDYLRTVQGQPFFLPDHLARFRASATAMHLELAYTDEALTEIIHQLIAQAGCLQAGIRILLTGGYSPNAYNPTTPNLLITCTPIELPSQPDFDKGASIMLYQHQRELPTIKSTNYLMAVWLQPMLREKAAQDVLYHFNNTITEFPRANFFMVTAGGVLVTPAHHILAGITRKRILAIAPQIVAVAEKDILVEELNTAQEIFMSSTTKRILPVLVVDGNQVGNGKPGKITQALYQALLAVEKT